MQVRETTLQELMGAVRQFQVPLFQRTYTWGKADREPFFACIDNRPEKGGTDKIGTTYRYFAARMAEPGPDGDALNLILLEQVIVSRLAIVDITAQAGDNVHRIFESLNATGVGLT